MSMPPRASGRSPNYPQLSISEAIERAKRAWRGMRHGAHDDLFVAQAIGFTSLNGTSRSVVSALRKYGLIEEAEKGRLRLSEDAKVLVTLAPGDARYAEAVRRCAFRPTLFADLYESYGEDPPDNNSLRYLLVGRRFLEDAADEVIKVYRATLEYVHEMDVTGERDNDLDEERDTHAKPPQETLTSGQIAAGKVPESHAPVAPPASGPLNRIAAPSAELFVTLSADCKVQLAFEGVLTKRVFRKLAAYLEIFAEDYPDDVSVTQPQRMPSADRRSPNAEGELALPGLIGQSEDGTTPGDE